MTASKHDRGKAEEQLAEAPATQADAERFAHLLGQLESGREALDELPNLGDDDELAAMLPMTHVLRSMGPAGELSDARREDVWAQLGPVARRQTVSTSRRRSWRWRAVLASAVAGFAALIIVVGAERLEEPSAQLLPPSAVSQLHDEEAHFAAALMRPGSEPFGDTRLRDLRAARFQAWRSDASLHRRPSSRRAP